MHVFCKLQPRLYKALPVVEQRGEQRLGLKVAASSSIDKLALFKSAAAAASRGLALVTQESSYCSLAANRQGLLCIARCCEAAAAMAVLYTASDTRRVQVEVAVAAQSAGMHHSATAAAWSCCGEQLHLIIIASDCSPDASLANPTAAGCLHWQQITASCSHAGLHLHITQGAAAGGKETYAVDSNALVAVWQPPHTD